MSRRPRPSSNTSHTLSRFLLYLRLEHTLCPQRNRPFTQQQLARALGYNSDSTISDLEDPEKCRVKYEHLERYADYFGIPAGVMLLITRTTSALKYARQKSSDCPVEFADLHSGVSAILRHVNDPSQLTEVMPKVATISPEAWHAAFSVMTNDFFSALSTVDALKNGSLRRRTGG